MARFPETARTDAARTDATRTDATRATLLLRLRRDGTAREVAWQELLAVTHDLDYRGWYCVERTQGDDPAGDAGRAIQYIRSLELG